MEPVVVLRNIRPSMPLVWEIRDRAASLERFFSGVTGCHVTVERADRHRRLGQRYQVRIVLDVPGAHIVVSRHGSPRPLARAWAYDKLTKRFERDASDTRAAVAVRAAFDAARRQLQSFNRRRRGHPHAPSLRTARLLPSAG